ncbi:Ser/Thr protein phosphatase [Coccidioides immitis RS]|uniref:Ser/Thr protein phosphatase n=2 Tax=Coccidioides immitis TaxID=5501 RepID=J3K5J8_COCIM|nr:Ser/Thr protein phosphatase [Coccidioides immitis RS]EAS29721.3 Ser/Thr protein phosphatase [Coccidioides immitis RS]KMU90467.1 vacuolar protein [Coccidioides immitis H538.4]
MLKSLTAVLVGLAGSVLGTQPNAPDPIPAPLRNLTWGQLNFLHTTDTHGWLAGHLNEAQYGADWGDYVSFAAHMRKKAEAAGTDLLLIDTGDRIEGNGLYDASDPKGRYTADIFKSQDIDVLCSGNHELYKRQSSEDEYFITVPNFKGHYISSNIDIIDPRTGDIVPLAPRFKKFTTQMQGIRIVAFGFLFNFKDNFNNTVVQPVEETVKQEWFHEAIQDKEVDLFLVIGHVPVQSKEYDTIFKAIRGANWDVPIQFFGGHFHIRDYVKYDEKSYGLASGRFMETIGFMSISGLSAGGKRSSESLSFNRRYIDNNLWSFHYHSSHNETTFPTEKGNAVSEMILKARRALNLDRIYGCSPENLWMSRAKYPSQSSIYTWLEEKVLPDTLRGDRPAMAILNTGAIRFDLFKGRVTEESAYNLSPFTGGFRFTKNVPYDKSIKILEVLNKAPRIFSQQPGVPSSALLVSPEQLATSGDIKSPLRHNQVPFEVSDFSSHEMDLIPGYTTQDAAGNDGDDTIHSPICFYRLPNCIQAFIPVVKEEKRTVKPDTVDLVYLEFIEPFIDVAAKFVGLDFDVKRDTAEYKPGSSLRSIIVDWVEHNWKCEG